MDESPNNPLKADLRSTAQPARPIPRPATSFFRRWARDTFSRESFVSSLKSLAWVAPLTILIWIYAEREQQATATVQCAVDVKSSDPSRAVSVLGPDGQPLSDGLQISADLTGPRARLEELREKLDPRSGGQPLQIRLEGALLPGQRQVDLARIVDDSRISSSGLTVSNPQPKYLNVMVDVVGSREVPVRVPASVQALAGSEFSPAKVKVTGPESVLAAAERDGTLVAYADVANLKEAKEPGRHPDIAGVRVTVPLKDRRVQVSPHDVTATLEVKPPAQETIPTVNVLVIAPPTLLDRYKLEYDPHFLHNVKIAGPPEQVAGVVSGPPPQALFKVTLDDVGGMKHTPLKIDLPEGVTVLGDDASREVNFQLIDRKGATEGTEP